MQKDWIKAEEVLEKGGIAVIPTDTLYGLVGSAFDKKAIERIYRIKERDKSKPLIVLISSASQLKKFGIKDDFSKIFKPKVSILLSVKGIKFKYIHRGTEEIAFRLISNRNKNLHNLIEKVGPIVAPSANPEGMPPALTISQAKKYFYPVRSREGSQRVPSSNGVGDKVDIYVNAGKKIGKPSTLIRVENGRVKILRQGIVKIDNK